LIPNPIRRVLSSIREHRVRALLMGGQACVLYGAAEFRMRSKTTWTSFLRMDRIDMIHRMVWIPVPTAASRLILFILPIMSTSNCPCYC